MQPPDNAASSPFLVVLEGIEGTGKSSLAPLVIDRLAQQGVPAVVKPEFPPTSLGQRLEENLKRSLFLSEQLGMSTAAAFFYMLHVEARSWELLKLTAVVLADRYLHSHAIYQHFFATNPEHGFKPSSVLECLYHLFFLTGMPLPDLVIILDTSMEVIVRRVSEREGRGLSEVEINTLALFQNAYRDLARLSLSRTVVLDSSGNQGVLADRVVQEILISMRSMP